MGCTSLECAPVWTTRDHRRSPHHRCGGCRTLEHKEPQTKPLAQVKRRSDAPERTSRLSWLRSSWSTILEVDHATQWNTGHQSWSSYPQQKALWATYHLCAFLWALMVPTTSLVRASQPERWKTYNRRRSVCSAIYLVYRLHCRHINNGSTGFLCQQKSCTSLPRPATIGGQATVLT